NGTTGSKKNLTVSCDETKHETTSPEQEHSPIGGFGEAVARWRAQSIHCMACPWRIVISPRQMAYNIVTSLFFRLLISKVLLVLTRHRPWKLALSLMIARRFAGARINPT